MHCNLESNEEGTKTHVSHIVLQVPYPSLLGSLIIEYVGLLACNVSEPVEFNIYFRSSVSYGG